ncbi:phytanoyl-CoA dioxygenase family protein [Dactylonectria macrodidyma]|uniref:Phytanoyl-CoA dioxygenase family protein n=1 Tax=Dactylonectria macrodidyma TaxID=307937 RepID=A0A9P9ERJ5_9HYPO|nr:phytanoyl-CoA dioxygenase family protein [Dactylonectria macrodidyma]
MLYQPDEPRNNAIINNQVGADQRLFRKPAGPEVQELINSVIKHGYVIMEKIFTHAEVDEAIQELRRLADDAGTAGPASAGGRNKFEGFRTKRIYALLNKSRVFDKFATSPKAMALNDYFLDLGWLLNTFHSISIQPGEEPQTQHHDDGHVTLPRPHRPLGTAIMVSLDAYTETNGSTIVVPESHEWGADRVLSPSEAIPVVMPKGSVVCFLGTLWHGGGQNMSDVERRALTVQYCQPWIRPFENQFLAVDFEKLPQIPKQLVDMMGYLVSAPFVGYVDGKSPLRAVEKHLQRREMKNLVARL